MMSPRIVLIHALAQSVEPINSAFHAAWPEAQCMNLLDDSLSKDLAAGARLDTAMHERFLRLAECAANTGCDGILFTCSAFGPCIETVARHYAQIPVLKPNEAMIAQAVQRGGPIGLVATFAPTLEAMPAEFPEGAQLRTALAEGALDALQRGDGASHDEIVAAAASKLADAGCEVIALAQFSMARARAACERAVSVPVLTTPDSSVQEMRRRLARA
jgi:aspartate/glutamate racemase